MQIYVCVCTRPQSLEVMYERSWRGRIYRPVSRRMPAAVDFRRRTGNCGQHKLRRRSCVFLGDLQDIQEKSSFLTSANLLSRHHPVSEIVSTVLKELVRTRSYQGV